MFYEAAQTVGPGWHKSYKPSHYEDMTWSPCSKSFGSPGTSPETYRRIIQTDEEFPNRSKDRDEEFPNRSKDRDEEFFSGRRSPTLPRRIFKEVWTESPSGHKFGDRPKLFKRIFKPGHWDEEFGRDVPHIRRVERHFDHDFDDDRPMSRHFDDEFEKRFNARDLKKDFDEEFQKAEGRVHHIPIMVERRMEEMKSRFGKNSPSSERERTDDTEDADEWEGPQVQNLRKAFEPEDKYSSKYSHRFPRSDTDPRPRSFTSPLSDTWDPHVIHTLPTRKVHKNSQSFDDSRHPISPKSVFRSYSETHEDIPRQQPQHSAAFRSHSDGHCPNQTYVTKIEIITPSEKEELRSKYRQSNTEANEPNVSESESHNPEHIPEPQQTQNDECNSKPKIKVKHENPSLQQIAVVLQNVEDLVLRVEAYSGAGRDKHYRFLDEMLTRCMLRLDDVETEGREDIRSARKAAVREVQNCIDKLEAKADESERRKNSTSTISNANEKENLQESDSLSQQNGQENQETAETKNGETDKEETKL